MIVIIVGANGAGKTTLAQGYVDQGFHRINRDELGGKLKDLHEHVLKAHAKGFTKFVLDNTYRNIESRRSIIQTAKDLGMPIKCVWLDTSLEDAQYNACIRMVKITGRILGPEEFKKTKNPNLFPPAALYGYRKEFEKPTVNEGFVLVERIPFVRVYDPTYTNKALILDFDGTVRRSLGAEEYPLKPHEVEVIEGCGEKIQEYRDQGYIIAGVSNQSGVSKGTLSKQDAIDCFEETCKLLGQKIDYLFCPHAPVTCYCRKPSSGLGAVLVEKYKLDPRLSLFVGDQTTDKTFAARCGFQYFDAQDFFGTKK